MTVMKCPECGVVSTFTHQWWTSTNYIAPVHIDEDGEVEVNFDNSDCLDDESEYDEDQADTRCDKCGAVVELVNIEVVDVRKQVRAA